MNFLSILANPLNLLVFLLLVTILVAAHELGHYLFARWFGMAVEEFSIGFASPKWVLKRKTYTIPKSDGGEPDIHETEFTLRPLPLGGFVRIRGMQFQSDGSETAVENGFYSKPPWARWLVLFAGPVFSLLAGFVLLIPLYMSMGITKADPAPVIDNLSESGPAYAAGLRPGDRILSLDGKPVREFFEVVDYVRSRPDAKIVFRYERKGKEDSATVVPRKDEVPTAVLNSEFEPTGESRIQGKIGISPGRITVPATPGQAFQHALSLPVKMVDNIVGIFRNRHRFESDMGGPVTMLAATAGAMESGPDKVIELAGLISISLGILNLLPFPPFDGGQMVIAFVELLRRGRRVSYKLQEVVFGTGMLLVGMLFIGVIWADVKRFFLPPPERKPAVVAPQEKQPPEPGR